jgi:NAD(P)-dependent dehydrogenase (short-subunit alcohol dehydrogenase family)
MSPDVSASTLFTVPNLVAIITGGGTGISLLSHPNSLPYTSVSHLPLGIGLMTARALALNGASRIFIIGRRLATLEPAASSINASLPHPVVVPLQGDVTSQSSLVSIAAHIERDTGYVNLVVANAGIMGPRPLPHPTSVAAYRAHALATPMQDFTRVYEANATSVYYTAIAFLELLDAGNAKRNVDVRSQVIATSSIGGFSRLAGASFAYSSSKAAVTHMCKMMSTAFVQFGIRVNVLAPGLVASELAAGVIAGLGGGEDGRIDASVIPAERTGSEEDIAGAVLYMTGRAGAYLNGSVIVVDGGRLGVLPSTY